MALHFVSTIQQRRQLESLAYWIADLAYIRERYGNDDPELQKVRDTLEKSVFPTCDKLAIPFWVQNSVIVWAENWRRTKQEYLEIAMREKGIILN